MASSKIKMTYGYEDGSTREVSLEPFALTAAALTNAKTNIKAFNSTGIDNVKDVFLSDEGASCTGILTASIITSNRQEINLNDA